MVANQPPQIDEYVEDAELEAIDQALANQFEELQAANALQFEHREHPLFVDDLNWLPEVEDEWAFRELDNIDDEQDQILDLNLFPNDEDGDEDEE